MGLKIFQVLVLLSGLLLGLTNVYSDPKTVSFSPDNTSIESVSSMPQKPIVRASSDLISLEGRIVKRECILPSASEEAIVIALGAYEGGTLSSTSVAGQNRVTELSIVEIAPGIQPIYIIASAFTPMIWRIEGDWDRVERFVAAPASGGAGVVGLPEDRVSVIQPQTCGNAHMGPAKPRNAVRPIAIIEETLGRKVDAYAGGYTVSHILLPSGKVTRAKASKEPIADLRKLTKTPPEGTKPAAVPDFMINSLNRFSPGGIANIEPETVVSSGDVERYEVLPQEAGLIQLYQDGKLTVERPNARRAHPGEKFIVSAPINRFPAGLAGAHSVLFVLPDEFPMPAGSKGHSGVIRQSELAERQNRKNQELRSLPKALK